NVLAQLHMRGGRLRDAYNAFAAAHGAGDFTRAVGFGARSMIVFEPKGPAAGEDPLVLKSVLQQELIKRGVLWARFNTLCFADPEGALDHVMAASDEALGVLCAALGRGQLRAALRGEPVEPVFRRTSNFHTKPREKALA